jgi:hypothetical protein
MRMFLAIFLTLVWFDAPSVSAEVDSDSLHRRALEGAKRAVRLVDQTSATFLETRKCFTCHTQTFAALVLTDAARASIEINEKNLAAQVERAYEIYDSLDGVRPDTVGHALLALDIGQHPPNDKTEAMLRYLLDYGKESGYWQVAIENREPAEASNFTTNYLAVRAANRYGTAKLKEDIETRRKAVEEWFAKTEAKNTEDQVFRLFLANELGISSKRRGPFIRRLLDEQLAGGGWAQKSGMKPDAYATASTLVALNKVAGISAEHEKWRKGVEYLLKTQEPDGSWHVASRVKPVQNYFESGFPHGKDQFISTFATGWATEALLILILSEES